MRIDRAQSIMHEGAKKFRYGAVRLAFEVTHIENQTINVDA